MSVPCAPLWARAGRSSSALLMGLLSACSSTAASVPGPSAPPVQPDSPLMSQQPGAHFDRDGGLTVVGAGRRLRVLLSAPIVACGPAFDDASSALPVAERASLTFRTLADACRHDHPAILLPEESDTAAPSELELSYREVASCAGVDLGASSGWVPRAVAESDPCPVALGLGWRLPRVDQLQGLDVDDRKAIAGALFNAEEKAGYASLILYARDKTGDLQLITLSPTSTDQAPSLSDEQRAQPFFEAALRCVRDTPSAQPAARATPPVLPGASSCLQALRADQKVLSKTPGARVAPELQQLKDWTDRAQRTPAMLQSETDLRELDGLLASPVLDQLARDANEERQLTERYAELAEGIDDPAVSPGERQRRRLAFDALRKRLGGQIVKSALASSADRTQLSAIVSRLMQLLAETKPSKPTKSTKQRAPDYARLLSRLRALRGDKTAAQ